MTSHYYYDHDTSFIRSLSFVDEDDEYSDLPNETISETALIVWFAVLAGFFCITAIWSIRLTASCREFYEWNAIRLILPGVQWILAIECATLSYDSKQDTIIQSYWAIAVYMLEACVAPGIFLSTFVITFLAYRTRSIPFCMIYRGKGRTPEAAGDTTINITGTGTDNINTSNIIDDYEEANQPLVRPLTMVVIVRLFALAIFILALVVNFDVVWNEQDLAGRTGWATIINSEDGWDEETTHIFLSLLPMALTALSCLYFTVLLYQYGTFFSMVIYSNIFNPWIAPVIGTGFLIAGQCFGPDLFPILSNTGILLYHICFLRGMYEIRYDMRQAGDLGNFLTALGDEVVTGSMPAGATTGDLDSSGYHFQSSDKDGTMVPPGSPPTSGSNKKLRLSSKVGNEGIGFGDPEEVPPLPSTR